MSKFFRTCAAGFLGISMLGFTAAYADYRDRDRVDSRPDHCDIDHDHRVHDSNYYNYYPQDRYSRASRTYSTSTRYYRDRDDYRYGRYNSYDGGRRYARHHGRGRVVSRRSHHIAGTRATAIAVERAYRNHGRYRRVCTVSVVGPDAAYINRRDVRWVARTHCSRYARIRYNY